VSTLFLWWTCWLVAVTSWYKYSLLLSSCLIFSDFSKKIYHQNFSLETNFEFQISDLQWYYVMWHVDTYNGNEFNVTWGGWWCYDFFPIFLLPNFILYFTWTMQKINYLYCRKNIALPNSSIIGHLSWYDGGPFFLRATILCDSLFWFFNCCGPMYIFLGSV
jgi:hypothetical protein